MLTIVAFIFTLGLLVTIHEYGHFIVARWFDVKVIRFSIGFGNPIWKKTFGKDQTELTLSPIPLGGYVKMLDERELKQEEGISETGEFSEEELNRSFNRLPVLKRIAIVLAGPAANLLLAIVLYWILFSFGVVGLKPSIDTVTPNTPAAMAGFVKGDMIEKVSGDTVHSWQEVLWKLLNKSTDEQPVNLQVSNQVGKIKQYRLSVSTLNQSQTKIGPLEQLGFIPAQPVIKPILGEVSKEGAANLAGLKSQDLIVSVNKKAVDTWQSFVEIVRNNPNQKLNLIIERDQVRIAIHLVPKATKGNDMEVGKIGAGVYLPDDVSSKFFVTTHYSPIESLIKASQKTWETSIFSLKMLGNMLIGNVSWKMMSGPVTIANYAGQSANMGIKAFIGFLALISISIGVINLLPIPVLDGGHFMYYMFEFVTGEPVSESTMVIGQKIGLLLIGAMMVLAFYNDINRFLTG